MVDMSGDTVGEGPKDDQTGSEMELKHGWIDERGMRRQIGKMIEGCL